MTALGGTIYESDPATEPFVVEQLNRSGRVVSSFGQLHLVGGDPVPSYWHRNLWLDPVSFAAPSVSAAAEGLRSLGALWTARPQDQFRRHALVTQRLPRFAPKPRAFPFEPPHGPLGSWALRGECVWASRSTSSPFPAGDPLLFENKVDPPSSAYRKLQEAFLVAGHWPGPGSRCLDLGGSPGGWTWVLAELGASVVAVDRAPLDARVAARPGVETRIGNAFALGPGDFGSLDWLCSDVVCYPDKLWSWLQPWIEGGQVAHFVVTVKLQGTAVDWTTLERFATVPGAQLVHLHHNKHELTWLWSRP